MAKSPEKPLLSVVSRRAATISPPRPLGSHGTALWDRIQAEYGIYDCGGAELLAQACQALDRAEGLAAAIARDGDVVRSRGGVFKTHPAGREELACRSFVVRTLERLGVTSETVKRPGRPPSGGVGWQPDDDEP